MKNLLTFLVALFSGTLLAQTPPPPATVDTVDLKRYAGLWYEIARYPFRFERDMTHVTAEYIDMGSYIRVINRGVRAGKQKEARGKAFVVKNSGNAKLRVQFFWPFRGDYWIIGLADDYSWAVVSNRKRSTLWILSRTPELPRETLQPILNKLEQEGFHIGRLEWTDQSATVLR